MDEFNLLKQLLIRHEDIRLKPYPCSEGKLTIGCGRNLEDIGISKEEALFLLSNDMIRVNSEAEKTFPWFSELSEVRQAVVLSMLFNLGLTRLGNFKKFLISLDKRNYENAANEMLLSKWAGQVGKRALALSLMMRTNEI